MRSGELRGDIAQLGGGAREEVYLRDGVTHPVVLTLTNALMRNAISICARDAVLDDADSAKGVGSVGYAAGGGE